MVIFLFLLFIFIAVFAFVSSTRAHFLYRKFSKKCDNGVEINITDIEELKNKLTEVNDGCIDSIDITENNQIEVTAKYEKYIFYIDNGAVKAESPWIYVGFSALGKIIARFTIGKQLQKFNEINNIFNLLEISVNPNSQIKIGDNSVKIKKMDKSIKFSTLGMIVVAVFLMIALFFNFGETDYVSTVQSAELADTGYTYQEAYDSFFEDPQWSHFTSDEGEEVIEFTGDCEYLGEYGAATVQFVVTEEKSDYLEWEVTYFAFEDEVLTVQDYYDLIDSLEENLSY